MLRSLWVWFVALLMTVTVGPILIIGAYLRFPDRVHDWGPRFWCKIVIGTAKSPVTVHGLENIRRDGPQIITANHQSMFDVFVIALHVPVRYHFVAKKEIRAIPVFGKAVEAAGHIFIDRGNRALAIESLKVAGRKIKEKGSTAVTYPEGTRSLTGDLQKFKKGPFVMAIESGVPIVPTVVDGVFNILPKKGIRIRPHPIAIVFGKPIETEGYEEEDRDALMVRVHAIMAEMLARLRAPEDYAGPRWLTAAAI